LSTLTKGLILVAVILAIGVGLVVWKKKVGGSEAISYNSISKHEIELLLSDVAAKNPMGIKRLADDPEMKKKQLESLKQLMAFAVTAQKEGYTDDPTNKQELRNIRDQIEAQSYDQEINKDKGPMPPFGFITEDQVNQYWAEDQNGGGGKGVVSNLMGKIGLEGDNENLSHEAEFQKFLFPDRIKQLQGPFGGQVLKSFDLMAAETPDGGKRRQYRGTFQSGMKIRVLFTVDAQGKISVVPQF